MKSFLIQAFLFATTSLAVDSQVSENLPLSTAIISVPAPEPEPTEPTKTSTSASSTPTNCYIDGPCDCDEDDPDYFQCITNPNCRECFINDRTLTPLTSTQSASLALASSSTASQDEPPDNCWIGGPCDCSAFEEYSDPWYQCISNPACTHCYIADRSLTPRSSSVPIASPPSSSSSSDAAAGTKTQFKTMPPGTYTVTSKGTVIIVIVTDEAATRTEDPASTLGGNVRTRTTLAVQTPT